MIKALILTHIWSLVIAAMAWVLQRDTAQRIGVNFPAPTIWLGLIFLTLLPGGLTLLPLGDTLRLPQAKIFETLTLSGTEPVASTPFSLNYINLYMCLAGILMGRTLWQWARLQRLPLESTSEPDIFLTRADQPPLTLSWPRRVVVLPHTIATNPALIRHERTHLYHNDAEITLGLLLLNGLMVKNPGVNYLVRQWRQSIELRADQAATKLLTTSERKDYADLLLSGLRHCGQHTDGSALPCPTAHLTSTHHRSVKMRLTQIMQNKPNPRKYRWRAALLLSAIGANTLGLMSPTANANDETTTLLADKIIYAERMPPKMPASCPGLNLEDIKIDGKAVNVNGIETYLHTVSVGYVTLRFDVRPDGSTHNLRIVESNHPCFEPEAKAAVAKWMAEPQGQDVKDVAIILKFMMTGETHEDLEGPLNKFLQ